MADLQLSNVTKRFGETVVVSDVSLEVPSGSLVVILGPSGCGKSTILRLIAGIEEIDGGSVAIDGSDVTHEHPSARGVSMVFQSYALFPHLSVRENIEFGLRARKVGKSERADRTSNAAELVGLQGLEDRKPSELSGGQRQRVAVARAVVADRAVCLMDEPLSNLDAKLRTTMRTEIRDLQQRLGLTMVYVTHDQTEAMTMADQLVIMNAGRVEQAGSPRELYENPASPFVAGFLGDPPMNLMPAEAVACGCAVVGVRPEAVELLPSGAEADPSHDAIDVTVTAVEDLGALAIVRAHLNGRTLNARVDRAPGLVIGDKTRFTWPKSCLSHFDSTNRRLPSGVCVNTLSKGNEK